MDTGSAGDDGGKPQHVCGLCWTSFSSPTELQQHCLECFSEDTPNYKHSAVDANNAEELQDPTEDVAYETTTNEDDDDRSSIQTIENGQDGNESDSTIKQDLQEDSLQDSSSPLNDSRTLHLCKVCPKTFTNYGSYRRHLRMHSCGHRYTCDICGKQFFRRYLWIKHYEKIHNSMMQNMCQCNICEMWLKNSDTLKEHVRTKHKESLKSTSAAGDSSSDIISESPQKNTETIVLDSLSLQPINETTQNEEDSLSPGNEFSFEGKGANAGKFQWMCNLCNDVFVTKAHLMKHKEDIHGKKRGLKELLEQEIDEPKKLKIDLDSVKDVYENFIQEINSKDQTTPAAVTEQVQIKSKRSSKGIPAEYPSFVPSFSLPGISLCDPSKRGVFVCDICKKTFINRSSYLRHKKMHTGVRPYACNYCCMSFFRSESLTTHKKKHLPGDKFKCYVCNHIEEDSTALSNHFLEAHSKLPEEYDKNTVIKPRRGRYSKVAIKKETEKAANKQTSEGSILEENISKQSPLEENSSTENSLVSMNGDHTKDFVCSCLKTFNDEESFQKHKCHKTDNNDPLLKRVEDLLSSDASHCRDEAAKPESKVNDKPPRIILTVATCKVCNQKFTSKSSYNMHMMMHLDDIPPTCDFCGQCFDSQEKVTLHTEQCHSSTDEYVCYYCKASFESSTFLKKHITSDHSSEFFKNNIGKVKEMTESYLKVETNKDIPETNASFSEEPSTKDEPEVQSTSTCAAEEYTPGLENSAVLQDYQCGWCEMTFKSFKFISEHFRDHHGVIRLQGGEIASLEKKACLLNETNGSKECSECSHFLSLNKNYERICSEVGERFVCNLCLKTFSEAALLEDHRKKSHLLLDWFTCEACDVSGPRDVMEKHVLTHMLRLGSFVVMEESYDPEDLTTQVKQIFKQTEFHKYKPSRTTGNVGCQTESSILKLISSVVPEGDITSTTPSNSSVKSRRKPKHPMKSDYSNLMSRNEDLSKINNYHSIHTEDKDLSKEILDLLPKNGELTMIPLKADSNDVENSACHKPFPIISPGEIHKINSFMDQNENFLNSHLPVNKFFKDHCTYSDEVSINDYQALLPPQNEKQNSVHTEQKTSAPSIVRPWVEYSDPASLSTSEQRSTMVVLRCEDCKRLFTHYSSWKRHRRQHLGLNIHSCPVCQRIFYRKDQCDKHIKSHKKSSDS